MVTYADMLTLLLVLFIVLYAISQVNTSKFSELKSSLASAFKNGQPSVLSGGSGIVGGDAAAQQANPNIPVFSPIQRPLPPPSLRLTRSRLASSSTLS